VASVTVTADVQGGPDEGDCSNPQEIGDEEAEEEAVLSRRPKASFGGGVGIIR